MLIINNYCNNSCNQRKILKFIITMFSILSDFVIERDKLSREVFPRLQAYCQSLGLEFQVVDMRWGVRDENISYHQTSDVCIQEIHNCQRLSVGPSFLVCSNGMYYTSG